MKVPECLQNAASSVEAGAKKACKQAKEFVGKEFTKMDPITAATACDVPSCVAGVGVFVAGVAAVVAFIALGFFPEVATVALIIGIVSIFNPLLTPVAIGLGIAAGSLLAVVLVAGIIAAIGAGCVASSSAA